MEQKFQDTEIQADVSALVNPGTLESVKDSKLKRLTLREQLELRSNFIKASALPISTRLLCLWIVAILGSSEIVWQTPPRMSEMGVTYGLLYPVALLPLAYALWACNSKKLASASLDQPDTRWPTNYPRRVVDTPIQVRRRRITQAIYLFTSFGGVLVLLFSTIAVYVDRFGPDWMLAGGGEKRYIPAHEGLLSFLVISCCLGLFLVILATLIPQIRKRYQLGAFWVIALVLLGLTFIVFINDVVINEDLGGGVVLSPVALEVK